jgi:hypothetical protein
MYMKKHLRAGRRIIPAAGPGLSYIGIDATGLKIKFYYYFLGCAQKAIRTIGEANALMPMRTGLLASAFICPYRIYNEKIVYYRGCVQALAQDKSVLRFLYAENTRAICPILFSATTMDLSAPSEPDLARLVFLCCFFSSQETK